MSEAVPAATGDDDDLLTIDDLPYLDANSLTQAELLSLCKTSKSYFDPDTQNDVVIPPINRAIFNESAGGRRQTYTRVRLLRHSQHRAPKPRPSPSPAPMAGLDSIVPDCLDRIFGRNAEKSKPRAGSENIVPDCVDRNFLGNSSLSPLTELGLVKSTHVGTLLGGEGEMGIGGNVVVDKDKIGNPLGNEGEVAANSSEEFVSVQSSVLGSILGDGRGMIIGRNVVVEKKESVGGAKGKGKRRMMGNGGAVELRRISKNGEMVDFDYLETDGDRLFDEELRKRVELRRNSKNGEMVDFDYLETNGDRLFEEELRKRIAGLEKAEQVLGFLESLDGEWCSSRKKRKYVQSSELGDALPIGWKVVVGVVKRGSFVSLCRKEYVSPTGQKFVSCKEAALFLRSHFVPNDTKHPTNERDLSMAYDITPPSNDVAFPVTSNVEANKVPVSDYQGNGILVGMDNLVEVQVKYKRHISEGVIIRDGKYECQICHKIFDERRKYNGHVGVHARKAYNRSRTQVHLGSPTGIVNSSINTDKKSLVKMKVEFVDKAADSSYMTSSNNAFADVTSEQLKSGSNNIVPIDPKSSVKMKVEFVDIIDGKSYTTSSSMTFANVTNDQGALDQELTHDEGKTESEEVTIVDDLNAKSVEKFTRPETYDLKCETNGHSAGYSQKGSESHDALYAISQPDVLHNEFATSTEFFMQSFEGLPEFTSGSAKGDYHFLKPDPKCQNLTGFDELGPDDLEALGYSLPEGQDSASLPGPLFDLANDSEMNTGVNCQRIDSEMGISSMDGRHMLTTSCVWCQSEFQIQTHDPEAHSDTIGYMCPTCKENIPGLS